MSDNHEHDGGEIYLSPTGTPGRVYGYLPDILQDLSDRLSGALDRIAELEQTKAER